MQHQPIGHDAVKSPVTFREMRSELAERIVTANFLPMSALLHELLTEISKEEDSAGRGMLSAVVVRQDREMNGFIEVAAQFGRDVSDPERFWDDEIERVCKYWAANGTTATHIS